MLSERVRAQWAMVVGDVDARNPQTLPGWSGVQVQLIGTKVLVTLTGKPYMIGLPAGDGGVSSE